MQISVLALLVALSGVAVASSHLAAKNSVNTKAIQKQAVKNSKVKKETLTG